MRHIASTAGTMQGVHNASSPWSTPHKAAADLALSSRHVISLIGYSPWESGCENGAGGCDCGCGCLPSSCRGRGRGRGRGPSCRGRGPADHRDCGSGCGCRIFGSGDRGRASTGRQRSGARRPWGCGSASGCGGCGSGTRPPLGIQASRHRHGRPAGGLRRAAGMEAGPWFRYSLPDLLSH